MDRIQDLLQQEISRKEFLRYIGVALLGVIGVTGILQSLTGSLSRSNNKKQELGVGYGYSAYGR